MATEQSPLLSATTCSLSRNRPGPLSCPPTFSMRYRTTCVTSKTGMFVLVALAVVNVVGFAPLFYLITTPFPVFNVEIFLPAYGFFMIELLMFPVAGLVGEVCCKRFKILIFGSVLIIIGEAIFLADYVEVQEERDISSELFSFLIFSPFLLIVPGVGMFQANALQYGVDQLNFASSEVLSSFVYWYYWTNYTFVSPFVALSFFGGFNELYSFITSILCATGILLTCLLCLTIYCCCKNPHLRTDPGHKVNPLKLIWKVMWFVKMNEFPLHRSAFTYNEMPSRLDLAKQRYGGPFTTEEVEDVKSFWRILLVLASLIGFQLQDDTLFTMTEALFLTQQNYNGFYTFKSPWIASTLVIAMVIPVYQFGIRPYFSLHIPRMLTRMGIGLVVVLISLLATTTYNALISPAASEVYVNSFVFNESGCTLMNQTISSVCVAVKGLVYCFQGENGLPKYIPMYDGPIPSFFWLVIPQALNGLAHMLVFLTALEFILAQAPRTMQGFLIGLWYAMQSVNVGISIIGYSSCAVFHWEYYASKTLLVLFSLVLFAIVACKYKYRQLNEDADINVRQEVEDIFERNFNKEAEYEQQLLLNEREYIVQSADL